MKEAIQNITPILTPIALVGAFWQDVIIPISALYTYSLPILLILMLSIFLLWILRVKFKRNQDNINEKRIKLIERCLTGTIILTVLCIFSFWINEENYLITEKSKILGKEIRDNMLATSSSINLNKPSENQKLVSLNKIDNVHHNLRNETETERRKAIDQLIELHLLRLIDSTEYKLRESKIERRFESIIPSK